MSNSTPLPWILHPSRRLARIVRDGGRDENVAQFVHAADAELACRAVNALGPLVAALDQVKAALGDRLLAEGPLAKPYAHAVMNQINEALRLAGKP